MTRFAGLAAMGAAAILGMMAPVVALRAAPPPLSVYGSLPGVEHVAISPSGNHIALIGVIDGVRRLVVSEEGKKSLVAFPLGDAKVRGIFWAGEDKVLLYKSDASGLDVGFIGDDRVELASMIVIPLNGEKSWTVFANEPRIPGGISGFRGIQERDGRYYGYFGGVTFNGDFRSPEGYLANGHPILYEVDLQTQRNTAIGPRFEGDGFRRWAMGPGGKVAATLDYTSRTGSWVIRNAAGTTILEGKNPLGDIGLTGLGAAADTIVYWEQAKGSELRYFELPLAGGAPKEIWADVGIHNPYLDDHTRQLVGYRQEGDVPAYGFFDPYRQKVINATLKAFPGLSVELQDWNDKFDRLIVKTEGDGDPQTWWMVDIKTGGAKELGFSYPIGPADVGPVQMVRYKAGDGMDINGVLTLPPGRAAKNLPVIILPHGGPLARDYPGFDWWAQAFASRGYAVLQPNFRGSDGYGAAFQRAGNGQWGRLMQTDMSDGLAYLAKQGVVDPKRACIMGASYGGYAALAGVTIQHGLYRCAVSVAGVSDPAKRAGGITTFGGVMKRVIEEEMGARSDLRSVSPLTFAAQADAPILLIHGKDDAVVPYDQSNDMAVALRAAGKPVEMVTLEREDHWLSRSETRLAMLQASLAFIEKNNPPDPAP